MVDFKIKAGGLLTFIRCFGNGIIFGIHENISMIDIDKQYFHHYPEMIYPLCHIGELRIPH